MKREMRDNTSLNGRDVKKVVAILIGLAEMGLTTIEIEIVNPAKSPATADS